MVAGFVIALIRLYQHTLSRLLVLCFGRVCRFEPSCSAYAVACFEQHGAMRGGLLSIRRVCKCHPFHPGGFDPPPPRLHASTETCASPPPLRSSSRPSLRAVVPAHARPPAAD